MVVVVVVVVVGATVVVVEVVVAGGAVVVAGAAVAVVVVEAPAEDAAEEAATSGITLGTDGRDAAGPDSEGRGVADEAVGAAATLASVSAESPLSPDEQAAATNTKQTNPQANRRFSFNNLFILKFYKPLINCPVSHAAPPCYGWHYER